MPNIGPMELVAVLVDGEELVSLRAGDAAADRPARDREAV